jgi:hypothetical protein
MDEERAMWLFVVAELRCGVPVRQTTLERSVTSSRCIDRCESDATFVHKIVFLLSNSFLNFVRKLGPCLDCPLYLVILDEDISVQFW